MNYRVIVFLLCSGLWTMLLKAQHQDVFPGVEGDNLLTALRDAFTPTTMLSYAEARDVLYGDILNENDSLSCLYTDYTIYLDPDEPPRQDAFEKGLNAEHIWPRSLGASGPFASADMHHIMPSRLNVNNDRGNLPFGELTDVETLFWYYKDIKTNQRPGSNIELYARVGSAYFTPPQNMKGDIARSMMYFYTIYKDEADATDPGFFQIQREDLCRWHIEDPVDVKEWQKTMDIAIHQDGKANPFVLDCTLAERSYCSDMNIACSPMVSVQPSMETLFNLEVYPNPTSDFVNIDLNCDQCYVKRIFLFDADGRLSDAVKITDYEVGQESIRLDITENPARIIYGQIFFQIQRQDAMQSFIILKK